MLRTLVVFVLLLVLLTGGAAAYIHYQWSKVASSPCTVCVAPANGAPYNVLLIGSDSRAGESAAQAQQFGTVQATTGQRSDTLKILHVDPEAGTVTSLSIPRDTFVTLSGMPPTSDLSSANKINAAFGGGPNATVTTIERTFGIPISHYIVVNFFGVQDAVDALGGISMHFPYPVRDHDYATGANNSGLSIPTAGCQVLNGSQALSLSRSRYFQYEVDGVWHSDPTSDLGRIERQNQVIAAVIDKAKATYNPLRLNSLINSVAGDFSKDDGLSVSDILSLAVRYHALSGADVATYTLPTSPGTSAVAGSVEIVQPEAALTMVTTFLGGSPGPIITPPLDSTGAPLTLTTTTTPPVTASTPSSPSPSTGASAPTVPQTTPTDFDPTPC